jgi:hypothetical protein
MDIQEMAKEINEAVKLAELIGLTEDKLKTLKDDLEQAGLDTIQKQANYKQNKLSALLNGA